MTDDDSTGREGTAPDPGPPAAEARLVRRRGAIATGAAVLVLGGAIAAVIIKAASDGLRGKR